MTTATAIDARAFRDAMGCFATGICVATTRDAAGAPVGVTVNSFASVSLDPPLVLFCLVKGAETLSAFRASGAFALTVLADDQQDLSSTFAFRPPAERWAGRSWETRKTGSPILPGGLAVMDCELHAEHDGGDHVILVGRVVDLASRKDGAPLLYFRGAYAALT